MKVSKAWPWRRGSKSRTNAAGDGPIAFRTPSSARPARRSRTRGRAARAARAVRRLTSFGDLARHDNMPPRQAMSRIPSSAKPLTVGVVGLGAIGRRVCQALDEGLAGVTLVAATARDRARGQTFLKSLGAPVPFVTL